jgi:hypothetical protein
LPSGNLADYLTLIVAADRRSREQQRVAVVLDGSGSSLA